MKSGKHRGISRTVAIRCAMIRSGRLAIPLAAGQSKVVPETSSNPGCADLEGDGNGRMLKQCSQHLESCIAGASAGPGSRLTTLKPKVPQHSELYPSVKCSLTISCLCARMIPHSEIGVCEMADCDLALYQCVSAPPEPRLPERAA